MKPIRLRLLHAIGRFWGTGWRNRLARSRAFFPVTIGITILGFLIFFIVAAQIQVSDENLQRFDNFLMAFTICYFVSLTVLILSRGGIARHCAEHSYLKEVILEKIQALLDHSGFIVHQRAASEIKASRGERYGSGKMIEIEWRRYPVQVHATVEQTTKGTLLKVECYSRQLVNAMSRDFLVSTAKALVDLDE